MAIKERTGFEWLAMGAVESEDTQLCPELAGGW